MKKKNFVPLISIAILLSGGMMYAGKVFGEFGLSEEEKADRAAAEQAAEAKKNQPEPTAEELKGLKEGIVKDAKTGATRPEQGQLEIPKEKRERFGLDKSSLVAPKFSPNVPKAPDDGTKADW